MSKEKVPMPVDELTNLAVPILVSLDDIVKAKSRGFDIHFHHSNFSEEREELQSSAGRAMRRSRGQRLPENMHNESYDGSLHDVFDEPLSLPSEELKQFQSAILAISGVISRQAVDLRSQDPSKTVRLTKKQHEFLSSPKITGWELRRWKRETDSRFRIGRFFIKYALKDEFLGNAVTSNLKKDFQSSNNFERRRKAASKIIFQSLEEAIIPVYQAYIEAQKEGMVSPSKPNLLPLVRTFLPRHEFGSYYPRISSFLSPDSPEHPPTLQTGVDKVELAA